MNIEQNTTFPNPDYHSETDVEIAFMKGRRMLRFTVFSHLAEGIVFKVIQGLQYL